MAEKKGETKEKERTLEENFEELDNMIERLEERDVPLEESFEIYKKGMEILKDCNEKIDTVEKKMLQLDADGELNEFEG